MIGTSLFEYFFIRVCVIGLHYLAPLSVIYTIFVVSIHGFKATTYRLPLLIESIAIAETLFYLLVYLPYRFHLQREAVHPPAPSREQRRELFRLCNENIDDPEKYLQKWFLGAEPEDVKRENVKEFFLWAFFNRGGPPGDDDEELEEYVIATERLLHRPLEEGRGPAKALRLTLDRIDMLHRSLVWYFCVGFVDFLTYTRLIIHGFHFHRMPLSRFFTLFPFRPQTLFTMHKSPAKHTTYWHRPHTSKTKLPIVFIHGIGIGLYPYTKFLNELNSTSGVESLDPDEQVGIIAIEIMPVSFRITHSALRQSDMCAEIDQILRKHLHPAQKFILVSHSYGTVISTHLLKAPSVASRIGPVVLIDPVSILLHLPDVAYNFTRRQPSEANEWQLYYFASMDPGVSHTLSRHFFWNENVLWEKDIGGRKVTVSLGGRDLIVNTGAVGKYLSNISSKSELPNGCGNGNESGVLIDLDDNKDCNETKTSLCGGEAADRFDEEWKSRRWQGTGIDVLWFKDCDHAQVFDKPATRKILIDTIHAYCEDGG